ncbi:MAG TPA: acetylornithine deacetylase [Bryobacteraceae bacterium]|jgi:acetylornithine deacetylase
MKLPDMKSPEEFLLDLVAIPSVSRMSNQPVIDYAAQWLDPRFWMIHRDSYMDGQGTPKTNLIAVTKNAIDAHAELAFVCHTDTVPFQEDWQEAVHPARRDGRIYGRGSCDVKGYMACVISALGGLDVEALAKPLAVILTADEEIGCVGAKRIAARRPVSTRYMLIGEPTGLQPIRAGKGYALATVTVHGREAHSAFPSKGHSAIFDAGHILCAIESIAAELQGDENGEFDPPFTTLNVGLIEGGTAKNIVAGECRIVIEWRPVPGQDPSRTSRRIRQELASLAARIPGFDAEIEVHRMDPAFAPSSRRDLSEFLANASSSTPGTISFGSEAAHLSGLAEEVVVFGPGDMATAHKTGEFVPIEELEQCVAYITGAIERFCAAT